MNLANVRTLRQAAAELPWATYSRLRELWHGRYGNGCRSVFFQFVEGGTVYVDLDELARVVEKKTGAPDRIAGGAEWEGGS